MLLSNRGHISLLSLYIKLRIMNSFLILVKICSLLGFVPWYNPLKNKLVIFMSKILTGILVVINILNHTLVAKNVSLLKRMPNLLYAFFVSIVFIRSAYTKKREWQEWINLYKHTSEQIKTHLKRNLEPAWKNNLCITTYVLLFVINRVQLHLIGFRKFDPILELNMYTYTATQLLSMLSLICLQKGFKAVNHIVKRYSRNDLQITVLVKESRNENIKICKEIYEHLFTLANGYNDLFGWLTASHLMYVMVAITIYFQHWIESIMKGKFSSEVINAFLFAYFIRSVSTSDYLKNSFIKI